MVTSTGCSIKEAFNIPKKNKELIETYEENGRILEHLKPLEEENKTNKDKINEALQLLNEVKNDQDSTNLM